MASGAFTMGALCYIYAPQPIRSMINTPHLQPGSIHGDMRLSAAAAAENIFGEMVKTFTAFDLCHPIDSAIQLSNKAYRLLKDESTAGNFLRLGFQYGSRFQDPTFSEIFSAYPGLIYNSDGKAEMNESIANTIRGYSLATIQPFVNEVKSIVIRHRNFFADYRAATLRSFLHDIVKLHSIYQLGLEETSTISAWVSGQKLIGKLEQSYRSLKTLDARKAAEDHLKKIEKNRKGGIFYRAESDELFSEGYRLATRSEDPAIIHLITEHHFPVYEHLVLRFNVPFSWGFDPTTRIRSVISGIADGYAGAFYERHLREELKKLDTAVQDETASVDAIPSVLLKWKGDPDALIVLIRRFADEGLVSNTPPELAFFLKQHVDIFRERTVQDILKALSVRK